MARKRVIRRQRAPTRRTPRHRTSRGVAPARALAQTYLERFEAETPRAPSPALEGLVEPGERSPAFAGLAGQQPQQDFFQQLMARLQGPVYPGPSIAERIFGDTSVYPGPSLASQILGGTSAPFTQANLATPTGVGPSAGLTPSEMFARNADPYRPTRGRVAFGALMSALSHGVLPPYISFAGQAYIGLSDEDLSQNYVMGENGWVKIERGQAVVAGSDGWEGAEAVTYIPSYGGGGSARTTRSGLINWRI